MSVIPYTDADSERMVISADESDTVDGLAVAVHSTYEWGAWGRPRPTRTVANFLHKPTNGGQR